MTPYIKVEYIGNKEQFILCNDGVKTYIKNPYHAMSEVVTRKYELSAKHKHGTAKARFEHKEDVIKWLKTFKADQRFFTFNGEFLSKEEVIDRLEDSVKPTCSRCKNLKSFVSGGKRMTYCECKAPSKPTVIDKIKVAFGEGMFYEKGWRKHYTACRGVNFEPKTVK